MVLSLRRVLSRRHAAYISQRLRRSCIYTYCIYIIHMLIHRLCLLYDCADLFGCMYNCLTTQKHVRIFGCSVENYVKFR